MTRQKRIASRVLVHSRCLRQPYAYIRVCFVLASVLAIGALGLLVAAKLHRHVNRPVHEAEVENALAWLRAHQPADGVWEFEGGDNKGEQYGRGLPPLSFLGPTERMHAEPMK
jgi:hypothetical protein